MSRFNRAHRPFSTSLAGVCAMCPPYSRPLRLSCWCPGPRTRRSWPSPRSFLLSMVVRPSTLPLFLFLTFFFNSFPLYLIHFFLSVALSLSLSLSLPLWVKGRMGCVRNKWQQTYSLFLTITIAESLCASPILVQVCEWMQYTVHATHHHSRP